MDSSGAGCAGWGAVILRMPLAEALLWLPQENHTEPVMLKNDSTYSANSAIVRYKGESNNGLIKEVAKITREVQQDRVIT